MDILLILESAFVSYGYLIVFFAALFESVILLGFFLPGGLIVLLGGYFAQQNQISVILVTILAWLGMFLGDLLNYWLGKKGFHKILTRSPKFQSLIKNYNSAENFINKYGALAIFYSHILGYMRSVICFSAGVVSFPRRKYIFTVLTASLFWSLLFVGLGFLFGETTKSLSTLSKRVTVVAWLVIILFVLLKLMQRIIHHMFTQKRESL